MADLSRRPPRRRSGVGFALRATAFFAALYGIGFLVFLVALPEPDGLAPGEVKADAIVVLTGEGLRLPAAVELLQRGAGKRLLITGVNPSIDKAELASHLGGGPAFECCTDLGFEAVDTHGNAVETANWAREHEYTSLVVVTGYDHMPRSLLELSAAMPEIELIPYPVGQPEGQSLIDGRLPRLNNEYAKFLASWVRITLTERTS
jgi:uncharacterized SAM-binding protein YcdF (DUF218 family)